MIGNGIPCMKRKAAFWAIPLLVLILSAAILVFRPWHKQGPPLGPLISYESTSAVDANVRQFLAGDFLIIRDVRYLPLGVRQLFTEVGGTRVTMANPGEEFEATDVITDPSLPRKRLIFAGVSGRKCFVHYEQGGLGLSFLLALFEVNSQSQVNPLWLGHCGPAKNFDDLRLQVIRGCPM